jgi:tripartite-type tricarboxylate transporter receptor subunit TctC
MHFGLLIRSKRFVASALILGFAIPGALAQSFPAKPVRIVAPFPAGGSVDSIARIFGQGMSERLGQPVIVDNKPGADGTIAALEAIRARPDGYTLLIATNTQIVAVPSLRLKPPYDPLSVLTPVGMIGRGVFFLLIHPSIPANNLKELIAYAKSQPGKLNLATGNATGAVSGAQFARTGGIQITSVSYKGEAAAIPDLLSGRVQMMLATTTSLLTHAREGKLKALAVLGDRRSALAPDVPTFEEAGVRGLSVVPWIGVYAPAQTPVDVVTRLSREMALVLAQPAITQQLEQQAISISNMTPAQMTNFASSQLQVWARLIADAGIERE